MADPVMEKGPLATGTHPYRPLGRRRIGPGGNSGKSQPKVGCAQGLSKLVAFDPPTEVAAWDNDAHGNCAVATEVVPPRGGCRGTNRRVTQR